MSNRTICQPGPGHLIAFEPNPGRVVVTLAGRTIADTKSALILRKATYPAVNYIPLAHVDTALLVRTEHTSWCPYKGDASYYSIPVGGGRSVTAIWTDDSPFEAVAAIAGHVAFYADRVDKIEESPAV